MIRVCICFLFWCLCATSVYAENPEVKRDAAWRAEVAEAIVELIATKYVDIIPELKNASDHEAFINDITERAQNDTAFQMADILADLSLDPLTRYMSPETFNDILQSHESEKGAIGIEFHKDVQNIVINRVFSDSPAALKGLEPKDRILSIDGIALSGKSLSDVRTMLRGELGSVVMLNIERQGKEVFEVQFERAIIEIEAMQSTCIGGYIHLSRINLNDPALILEIEETLNQLSQNEGQCPKGLILDLRYNGGGLLDASIDFADFFVGKEKILTLKARVPEDDKIFLGDNKRWQKRLPIAILINEHTGSGAEMIVAAIRAHRDATTVGQSTQGAKSVQTVIPMGSKRGALILTTNKMLFAGENAHDDKGIAPDIIASDAQALDQAILWLNEQTK